MFATAADVRKIRAAAEHVMVAAGAELGEGPLQALLAELMNAFRTVAAVAPPKKDGKIPRPQKQTLLWLVHSITYAELSVCPGCMADV